MSDVDKSSDYEIGYGRPPRHAQFKKGQSGNPSGRPKGPPGPRETLAKVLSKKVRVVTSDGPVEMPMMEVVMTTMVKGAAGGSVGMTKLTTDLIRELEIGEDTHATDLMEADEAQFNEFLAIIEGRQK